MRRTLRSQRGQAVLVVLAVMLALQLVAWVFLARMHASLRLAGGSTRGLAALYAAEGGMQAVLHALEAGRLDPRAGAWPVEDATIGAGTFAVEAVEPLADGVLSIVVRGEAGGAQRRVKVLATVGPETLAYGVFAQASLRLGADSRTYVIPVRTGTEGCRRLGDLAAGAEIRVDGPRVALNAFSGRRLTLREGEVADSDLVAAAGPEGGLVDLVLPDGARLFSGTRHAVVGLYELRAEVVDLGVRAVRACAPPGAPAVDPAYYRRLAEANTANAAVNAAAGRSGLAPGLRDKTHSHYSAEEFDAVLEALREQPAAALQGVVVVDGDVFLPEGRGLTVVNGALIVHGDIALAPGASLRVEHGEGAHGLAGVVAWGTGMLQIDEGARLHADGLVLSHGDLFVLGATLDVKGAVAAKNVVTRGGTTVIRYDPRVLATAGLRSAGRRLARIVSWQELP